MKARAFTRLQTTLTLTPTGFADAVPPFNPLKLTNRAETADAAPDPGPVQDDAEVVVPDDGPDRRGREPSRPANCPRPKRRRRSSKR